MLDNIPFRKSPLVLGITGVILAGALTGCGGSDGTNGVAGTDGQDLTARPFSMSLTELSTPDTAIEQASIRSSLEATVDGTTYAIKPKVIVSTKAVLDKLGGNVGDTVTYGAWKNDLGADMDDGSGDIKVCTNGSGPDYTSLIEYNKFGESALFAITNMECSVGGAWITKLDQNPATGELTALSARHVDFKDVYGTYVNCAGMTTPWGTHLGSEEYEPPMAILNPGATAIYTSGTKIGDPIPRPGWASVTRENVSWFGDGYEGWHNEHMLAIAEYNNLPNEAAHAAYFGYYYGWVPEIAITSSNGDHEVKKHFAMGRFAHELSYVMPDNRTVYQSDDGGNTGLFMFIADEEKDLSAGTLYAAKWNDIDGGTTANGGSADITWFNLGHSDNATIKAAIDAKITFGDMFEKEEPNGTNGCDTAGFVPVNAYDHGLVCVRLIDGNYPPVGTPIATVKELASRLETRLYAGYLGATTEFNKEEGITFNPDDKVLYVAMSRLSAGMRDGDASGDKGGPNHIKLDGVENRCGAVYGMDVAASVVRDTADGLIDSSYVVDNMYGVVVGNEVVTDGCAPDSIANPDNLTYLPQYGQLVIGEDSGADGDGSTDPGFFNRKLGNFIWSYDVKAKTLTRIASTPAGAETTSPYWNTNINGWAYLMMVNQHPGGAESSIGYVGPFPQLD